MDALIQPIWYSWTLIGAYAAVFLVAVLVDALELGLLGGPEETFSRLDLIEDEYAEGRLFLEDYDREIAQVIELPGSASSDTQAAPEAPRVPRDLPSSRAA